MLFIVHTMIDEKNTRIILYMHIAISKLLPLGEPSQHYVHLYVHALGGEDLGTLYVHTLRILYTFVQLNNCIECMSVLQGHI